YRRRVLIALNRHTAPRYFRCVWAICPVPRISAGLASPCACGWHLFGSPDWGSRDYQRIYPITVRGWHRGQGFPTFLSKRRAPRARVASDYVLKNEYGQDKLGRRRCFAAPGRCRHARAVYELAHNLMWLDVA